MKHRQDFDFIECGLPLIFSHLLHGDLLDDHLLVITEADAQVDSSVDTQNKVEYKIFIEAEANV